MPPRRKASRILAAVSLLPPKGPSTDSRRAMVGPETPEAFARSAWDQASKARAALTWRVESGSDTFDSFSIDR